MIMEKLLGKDADELDAIDDAQLLEYFKPLLVITRPELAPKPEKIQRKEATARAVESKKDKALEIMRQMGINVKRW